MNYSHKKFEYAGIAVDSFFTDKQETFLLVSSFIGATEGYKSNFQDWLKKYFNPHYIKVKTGKRQVPATAYSIEVVDAYMAYRVGLGDQKALAIYRASFQADLEASVKAANGIETTEVQRETKRAAVRMKLCSQIISEHYKPYQDYKLKGQMNDAELTDTEREIMDCLMFIKDKEHLLDEQAKYKFHPDQLADFQLAIDTAKADIKALSK